MAFPIAAAIGAIGSVAGGLLGRGAANDAADAQERGQREAIELQRDIFDYQRGVFEPRRRLGDRADAALAYELGLGPRPERTAAPVPGIERIPGAPSAAATGGGADAIPPGGEWVRSPNGMWEKVYPRDAAGSGGTAPTAAAEPSPRFRVGDQTFDTRAEAQDYRRNALDNRPAETTFDYRGFRATPGYDFRLTEGMDALNANLAASGALNSGAAQREAMRYGQGLAAQEYGNYLNRLSGFAGRGANAGAAGANAAGAMGANVGNLMAGIGDAQAQGIAQGANALTGGIADAFGVVGRYFGQQPPAMGAATFGAPASAAPQNMLMPGGGFGPSASLMVG